MPRLLVRNAARIVTMDADRREIADGDILIEDGVIPAVGGAELAAEGAEVIDARGCVVTPGLVNTHHHLYQCLTRAVPAGQDALLFGWLKTLYPIWARMTPEDMFVSAQLGLAELALSGCTMSSDHLYLFPNGVRLEDTIEAAETIGIRFHPTRGAMSVGESAGGLPPDSLVEAEPAILADMVRVVDAFHDPRPGAMVRVGLAPCSPFSVSTGLMRDAARPRPRQGGDAAHPPRRERRGHRLFAGAVRLPARPVRRGSRLDRRPRLARPLREARRGRDRPLRPHRHRGRALPLLELPARLGDRAGAGDARRRRQGRRSASTARPATTPATCSARRGRRCCCSGSGTAPTR